MKTSKMFAALALFTALAGTAMGQAQPYAGGAYSQNFDSLANTGTANAWTQFLPTASMTGWYAQRSLAGATVVPVGRDTGTWFGAPVDYRAGDGSSNAGAIWSYGTAGASPSTERALGSIGSGTPGDWVWGIVLENTSSATYTSFSLAYTGEQWRDGGAATPPGPAAQTVDFDYTVLAAMATAADLQGSNTTGYNLTGASTLDFTSPTFAAAAGIALDGNAAANRALLSDTVGGFSWAPGQFLVLRWYDDNHVGNDHGLSIDDLEFTAIVPAPSTLALIGLGTLVTTRRRR